MGLESLIHNSSQKLFLPGEVVGGVYGIKVHHISSLVTLQRSTFGFCTTFNVSSSRTLGGVVHHILSLKKKSKTHRET